MKVRFTVRGLLITTAAVAYAIAIYLEIVRFPYQPDEAAIPMTPLPSAPLPAER